MSSTATPTAAATVWDIDPAHTGAHFSVKHLMVTTVRGQFEKVAGTVTLDPRDLSRSAITATIDTASISTGESQRDAHLRSADFFDVEKFPTIEFRSTKLARARDGYQVSGTLTIHGVTRPVVLEVESSDAEPKDPYGNVRRGAAVTTRINRKEFGLGWNVALEAGGFVVSDEVKIEIDLQLVRRPDAA